MEQRHLETITLTPEKVNTLSTDFFLTEKLCFLEEPAKIKFCSLAHDNTLVYVRSSAGIDELVHMDRNSQSIWRELLPKTPSTVFMSNSKQIYLVFGAEEHQSGDLFICSLESKTITKVELKIHTSEKILFPFVFEDFFCLITSIHCVYYDINYYRLDGKFQKRSSVENGQLRINLKFKQSIRKLNNSSKLGMIEDIQGYSKITIAIVTHQNSQKIVISLNQPTFMIDNLWLERELTQQSYLVKARISSHAQFFYGDRKPKAKQSLFIIDIPLGEKPQGNYDNNYLDVSKYTKFACIGTGITMVVSLLSNWSLPGVLLFVNPQTMEVLSLKEQPTGFFDFKIPQWSHDILCIQDMEKLNKSPKAGIEMVLIHFSLPNLKHLYIHFLDFINEDFEDDLISDVVDLLDQEQ